MKKLLILSLLFAFIGTTSFAANGTQKKMHKSGKHHKRHHRRHHGTHHMGPKKDMKDMKEKGKN